MVRIMLRAALILGSFMAAQAGAREISISLMSGQTTLVLNNPSSASVSYSVACFKPDGTSSNSFASQTLAANASTSHAVGVPDSGQCASGSPDVTGNDTNGKPYYFCGGTNTLAAAGANCGVGQAFCFPDLSCSAYQCGSTTYWLKNDGNVQYAPSCSGYSAVGASLGVAIGSPGSGQAKKTAGTCAFFYVAATYGDSTTRGSVCCSNPAAAAICKVTITSSSPNAYLSSPTFMGGAAF